MNHRQNNFNNGRRQMQRKVAVWPFVVLALLLITGFLAISLLNSNRRRNHSSDGNLQAAETSMPAGNASARAEHIPGLEIPADSRPHKEKLIRKDYEGFTLAFNPENHTPDWVGWELLKSEADGDIGRSNKFWQDKEVEGCPLSADYSNSGYDRGHLCPAADQKWSAEAMRDCFVMTNMCPQDHALNAGAWQTLEKKERLWAERDSVLVIVAGPIYSDSDNKRIGETGVIVPSAFFKVFLAPYVENPRAIGFIYPNMTAPGNMEIYSMSVDEVEAITGLDFFAALPDELENRIESVKSFTEWNR